MTQMKEYRAPYPEVSSTMYEALTNLIAALPEAQLSTGESLD
ncbi:hypothetical protein [Microbulbifer taiwanensis]|uniref:Uncharacterized protein n=1 Tax=Microbulbifer taiwanensis TaxID=986746 RepID=A0ABW1YP63_9GAMM|nr:hypothetical protein [Microbulbifer taiwanensis]